MIDGSPLRIVHHFTISSLFALTLLLALPATAQQDPTPIPFEPLTQSDLNVLTGNVQRPNGITFLDGTLYIACTGDSTIYETDSVTGSTRTYIWGVKNAHTLIAEAGSSPNALTLWVPDYDNNTLTRVLRGSAAPVVRDLSTPWGIVDVEQAYFLITSVRGGSVERITRTGERSTAVTNLVAPTGIARDEDVVYVANNGSARRAVEWFALEDIGDEPIEAQPLVRGIQNPTGLQMGPDGYLYMAYSLGTRGVVGRVDPAVCRENGGCGNDQVEIVLYTELEAPLAGLNVTPDMRLFVHTMFSPEIYWAQL